jgi:hypothetical protein
MAASSRAFKGERHSDHGLLWVGLEQHDGGGEIRQLDEREIKRAARLAAFGTKTQFPRKAELRAPPGRSAV